LFNVRDYRVGDQKIRTPITTEGSNEPPGYEAWGRKELTRRIDAQYVKAHIPSRSGLEKKNKKRLLKRAGERKNITKNNPQKKKKKKHRLKLENNRLSELGDEFGRLMEKESKAVKRNWTKLGGAIDPNF